MYVQCVKCLWEGYEASIEVKTSGKQEPMKCPECGAAEIVDREKVADYPEELFGLSLNEDGDHDDNFDDIYNLNDY